MVERFRVGVIAGTHGLKGEVKVFPTTDDPERFLDLKNVILDLGRNERVLTIRSVKFFKKFVILGFKEFVRIEDVEKLKGTDLLIPREEAIFKALVSALEACMKNRVESCTVCRFSGVSRTPMLVIQASAYLQFLFRFMAVSLLSVVYLSDD